MPLYAYQGKLIATEGNGNQLAEILTEAANQKNAMPGCQLYLVCRNVDEPDAVYVTEVWDSKEDHDNSLKLDVVKAMITKARPILSPDQQKGLSLEVLGGI